MGSLKGQLLLANGSLYDDNFRQTVVLIVHHDDNGAFGVVLNRPAPIEVQDVVPALAGLTAPGDKVFIGGPVEPEAAVVLAEYETPELAGQVAFGSVGLVTGDVEPGMLTGIRRARVYAGYSGWGAGHSSSRWGPPRGSWSRLHPRTCSATT